MRGLLGDCEITKRRDRTPRIGVVRDVEKVNILLGQSNRSDVIYELTNYFVKLG